MRLLLVEDEQRMAAAMQRGLVHAGFTVDVAHDGVRGLAMACEVPYDAIVLDVMLPGLSGYEVTRRLRAKGSGRRSCWLRPRTASTTRPTARPRRRRLPHHRQFRDVRLDGFTTNDVPWKFEAGTPPIAEAVGLGAAVEYLKRPRDGRDSRARTVADRVRAGRPHRPLPGPVIHGPRDVDQRGGVISFNYKDIHPHDLSQVLDEAGVCVRAGHHCAKPLMRRLGVGATARASFSVYNDEADVDALVDALSTADRLFD